MGIDRVKNKAKVNEDTAKKDIHFFLEKGMGHGLEMKRNKENSVLPRWKISPSSTQYGDSGPDQKSNCSPKKCYCLLPENWQISVRVYNVPEGICTTWECGIYLWDEKERMKGKKLNIQLGKKSKWKFYGGKSLKGRRKWMGSNNTQAWH